MCVWKAFCLCATENFSDFRCVCSIASSSIKKMLEIHKISKISGDNAMYISGSISATR